jgi:hypothetical protein
MNCEWLSPHKNVSKLSGHEKSLDALFDVGDMQFIKSSLSNNVITLDDIFSAINRYCKKQINYFDQLNEKFLSELIDFAISIGTDISIFQDILIYVISDYKLNNTLFYKLLSLGVTIPLNPKYICKLPEELFDQYIRLIDKNMYEKLEEELLKTNNLNYLKKFHSECIIQTNPSILVSKLRAGNTELILKYCISEISHDDRILDKSIIFSLIFSINLYNIIPEEYIFSEEFTLLIFLISHDKLTYMKHYHPNLIKYLDMDLYNYFCIKIEISPYNDIPENHPKLIELLDDMAKYSYEDFMQKLTVSADKAYRISNIKCTNAAAIKIASNIKECSKYPGAIVDDIVYADIINNLSILLNILKTDERLELLNETI